MPSFTQATRSDFETIVALMRAFYAGESLPFTPNVLAAAETLIDDDSVGHFCLIRDDAGAAGYFVLTYGFSLERGGRFALLDELFILPAARNRGLGQAALGRAVEIAAEAGCRSLHLEVDQKKPQLLEIYRRAGFLDTGRHYLTRPL